MYPDKAGGRRLRISVLRTPVQTQPERPLCWYARAAGAQTCLVQVAQEDVSFTRSLFHPVFVSEDVARHRYEPEDGESQVKSGRKRSSRSRSVPPNRFRSSLKLSNHCRTSSRRSKRGLPAEVMQLFRMSMPFSTSIRLRLYAPVGRQHAVNQLESTSTIFRAHLRHRPSRQSVAPISAPPTQEQSLGALTPNTLWHCGWVQGACTCHS